MEQVFALTDLRRTVVHNKNLEVIGCKTLRQDGLETMLDFIQAIVVGDNNR
jgi:hypothetical protein